MTGVLKRDDARLVALHLDDGEVKRLRELGEGDGFHPRQLSIARTPDLDKDGCDDLVIGYPDTGATRGEGQLLSGSDWTCLSRYTGHEMEFLGAALCSFLFPGVKGTTAIAIGGGL